MVLVHVHFHVWVGLVLGWGIYLLSFRLWFGEHGSTALITGSFFSNVFDCMFLR